MTVSKPLPGMRNTARRLLCAAIATSALASAISLSAQDTTRFVRLELRDKGTPRRALTPSDSLYPAATAHLTPRALARRAKVLPADRLVSTDDLPPYPAYLAAITATGATVVQSSRWLNTVMVRADSMTIERLRGLPFLTTVDVMRSGGGAVPPPLAKFPRITDASHAVLTGTASGCLAEHYGLSAFQNRFMGIDEAHRLGIAGEGVLVGVLDAGFERAHRAFAATRIEKEFDFIYGDTSTANEPEDSLALSSQEEHGTMVLSLIGATWRDTLVGGAPAASFALAKTEDLRYERHVEEDNFVAGLEWLEAQGVDITNTSLGYTVFDAPEQPHSYGELDGHSVPASRAVNHATALGVVCIAAAGNEGRGSFIYVGVPAEADSSIAAAAVDSSGRIAGFSSRGMSGHTPPKPDVAAFGVGNWAAHPSSLTATRKSQGTSFAAPMTAAVAALVLSAAPELRPWELRAILERSAVDGPVIADTAVGAGIVNAGAALRDLARTRIVVGVPAVSLGGNSGNLSVAAAVLDTRPRSDSRQTLDSTLILRVRFGDGAGGAPLEAHVAQPIDGIARWEIAAGASGASVHAPLTVDILDARDGRLLRRQTYAGDWWAAREPATTLCAAPELALIDDEGVSAYPNPFASHVRLSFELERDAPVSLTIFNSRGEEVARLLDGVATSAGVHSLLFDARGLPSGAYYAQLRAGDVTRSGAMIFLP